MPKAAMDYSKTNIYKIVCNDLTIKDCYVGHTTDMTKRKWGHKSACNNEKNKAHNYNIYKIIRENGGWDNWNMLLVEEFPCKDKYEACKREREVYEELDAKMNMVIPYRTQEEHKEYHKQYNKQYSEEHKEELKQQFKQYRKEYRETHKEERKEYNKQYWEEHKKERKEYQKQYREEHKEYKKQHDKQYYQENKEEQKQKHKEYRETHKEECKEYNKQYNKEHKAEINKKLKEKNDCVYCAKQITKRCMNRHLKKCKSNE